MAAPYGYSTNTTVYRVSYRVHDGFCQSSVYVQIESKGVWTVYGTGSFISLHLQSHLL